MTETYYSLGVPYFHDVNYSIRVHMDAGYLCHLLMKLAESQECMSNLTQWWCRWMRLSETSCCWGILISQLIFCCVKLQLSWGEVHYFWPAQAQTNPLIWEVSVNHYTEGCHYSEHSSEQIFPLHKYMTQGTTLTSLSFLSLLFLLLCPHPLTFTPNFPLSYLWPSQALFSSLFTLSLFTLPHFSSSIPLSQPHFYFFLNVQSGV